MPLASTYFQRGLRSAQPAATAVKIGTLYYVTDESVTERSTGSAWESYSDGGAGNVVGVAAAVAGEVALFDGTTGKLIKRATGTGVAHLTSGVLSAANVNLASEVTGTLAASSLGTTGAPEFARLGVGAAADANSKLKIAGDYWSPTNDKGSSGTSITINWRDGNTQLLTLTGNCTLTLSNPQDGGRYLIVLEQDGTGSRTVTWPSAVKWPAGAAPTLSTTAGKCDIVTLVWVAGIGASGNYIAAANLDYTPA